MTKSKNLWSTIAVLCFIVNSTYSQTYNVNWVELENSGVSTNKLDRLYSNKQGSAISDQVLYGVVMTNPEEGPFNNGYLEYVATNNETGKDLGFSLTESNELNGQSIKYAFRFRLTQNGYQVHATVNNVIEATDYYSTGDVFQILRDKGEIIFLQNSYEMFKQDVDPNEDLYVEALLGTNSTSPFDGVLVNFNTPRLKTDFNVNNSTGLINTAATGGSGSFISEWNDGSYNLNLQTELSGTYTTSIVDEYGTCNKREVSVGSDVTWQDFQGTLVESGILLSESEGAEWVSARSTNSLGYRSSWWIENNLNIESYNKAFGASLEESTAIEGGVVCLDEGFHISNDEDHVIQIVHAGSVVKSLRYKTNDIFKLMYDGRDQVIYWKINGVIVHQIEDVTYSENLRIIGLVYGSSSLSEIRYLENEKDVVTTSFNNDLEQGTVTVDLPDGTEIGPFRYIISQEPILELSDLFTLITDSIDIEIDSLDFFNGNVSSTEYSFSGLQPAGYYVSVFNTNGDRIYGEQINLSITATKFSGDNLDISVDEIVSLSNDSYSEITTYANQDNNFSYGFKLLDADEEQAFGLISIEQGFTELSNFNYGVSIYENKLKTIIDGELGETEFFVRKNSKVMLESKAGVLEFIIDGLVIETVTMPEVFNMKGGIFLKKPGIRLKPFFYLLKQPFKISIDSYPIPCGETLGGIAIGVSTPTFTGVWYPSSISFSILEDPSGQLIENVSSTTFPYGQSFTGYTAGTYTVQGSVVYTYASSNSVSITIPFYRVFSLGHEVVWHTKIKTEEFPTFSTLRRTTDTPVNDYGLGLAKKAIEFDTPGWVNFKVPNHNQQPNSRHYLIFNESISYSQNLPNPSENYLLIGNTSTSSFLIYHPSNAFFNLLSLGWVNQKLRLELNSNNELLLKNFGSNIILFNLGSFTSSINLKALLRTFNARFTNIESSYPCDIAAEVYYQTLDRELDGGFYRSKNGLVGINYLEEYSDSDGMLTYEIFDEDNQLVYSNSNTTISVETGDNRFLLNFNCDGNDLGEGTFYLNVKNEKNEVRKIRLLIEQTVCN